MIDLLAMLPAFALGWLVVRVLAPMDVFLEIPLAIGAGAGFSSVLFFVLTWLGRASRSSILAVELVAIAAGAALLFFQPKAAARKQPEKPSWMWLLRIAAAIALILTAMSVAQSISASPDGGYDAAAIWNLRARYLAGGPPSWHYAVSDETGTNHPGYPLLLSSFVARTWILEGDLRSSTPAALGAIFALATIAALAASVAAIAGEALGWLAALVLLATDGFVSQASVQYADIPLALFVLAPVALLAIASTRQWPPGIVALAGIFAGLAAWTKNEGLPFLALIFLVVLWRAKGRATWFAAAAAPVLIVTLALKFALVQGKEQMFPATLSQALKMIADPSRWSEIIASFAKNFRDLGFPWAHPILLMAILAWALGFIPEARSRLWLLIAPLGLLAADFGIYLITMSGLTWHLGTSNNRVIVQVWPALILALFTILRIPAVALPVSRKKEKP